MWLSEIRKTRSNTAASHGSITIGGYEAAVMTDTERRNVEICMPGGYLWIPQQGKNVISIESENAGQCILGYTDVESGDDMQPGEVRITSSGGAVIVLKNDGKILLKGDIQIDGSLFLNGNEIV